MVEILFSREKCPKMRLKINWSVKTSWHTRELLAPVYGLLVGSSTHSNDYGNSNENNKNSTKFIKQHNNYSSRASVIEDARKTTIFSNRFMNFRIQLQKILSLLVLAIERQFKLKCRYHTWTSVITLETGSHRTFWRFDILTRGTVFQYGAGAVAVTDPGEGPGGSGLPLTFRPNWGPKGSPKNFLRPPPPPYLSVWVIVLPHIWRSVSATE